MKESIPHIPVLRLGTPYEALEATEVCALGSGERLARVSRANAGVIRRDSLRLAEARRKLAEIPCDRLLEICAEAGERFLHDELPIGSDGPTQSPDEFVRCLSATSGLPHTLARANMQKIHEMLVSMRTVLAGLTRGLDLSILDRGVGEQEGIEVSFYPTTDALGVVLPSNSPGVNSLWIPAVALKTPVILKPGREEPWTPYRVIQALIAAGCPAEALGFYPTDHEGASAVTERCGRSIIFGGPDVANRYAGDPRVEVHGPGWSKVLIGEDQAGRWSEHLNVLVDSVAANSGRSCINASTILTPSHNHEITEAIAERLVQIEPRPADDPEAKLSAIANPKMAEAMNQQIEQGLQTPGAEDVTARLRGNTPRLVEVEGKTYQRPTLIRCDSFDHPLANREFLFPYAAVVPMPQEQMCRRMGDSLVVTALTEDRALLDELLASPHIQRLNLGPVPTSKARWDQPHEGNLFELLYHRRAIQRAEPIPA